MDKRFWRGKRVFLTGHTGFKGGWLTLWLRLWGAETFGYALAPNTAPCLYEAAGVAEAGVSDIGDGPQDRSRACYRRVTNLNLVPLSRIWQPGNSVGRRS